MKINKAKSNLSVVNGKPCITAFAHFKTDDGDKMTACFQLEEDEEILFVYDGYVSIEDPGEDPEEEFSSLDEAKESEYGEVFDYLSNLTPNET